MFYQTYLLNVSLTQEVAWSHFNLVRRDRLKLKIQIFGGGF